MKGNKDYEVLLSGKPMSPLEQRRLADILGVPVAMVLRLRADILSDPAGIVSKDVVADYDKFISEHISAQILILPTYRRIEKDLEDDKSSLQEAIARIKQQKPN